MKVSTRAPRKVRTSGSSRRKPKTLKDGSVPEKVIQRQILDWLKQTGLLHWRQNSGTVMFGYRKILLGMEGLPDILIVVPPLGRVLGLEVKSAKGTLRPAQKAFRASLEAVGGHYRVVRTLKESMDAVAGVLGEELWKQLPMLAGQTR